MVILGLGSNLGDRLAQLRHAVQLIKKIPGLTVEKISPIYISDALLPKNAPASWNKPYLNCALRCETKLNPYDLLQQTKQIEKKVGRVPEKDWGPRIMDIDLLAWDDLIQYDETLHIPHENLHERPFALWPLADIVVGLPFAGSCKENRCRNRKTGISWMNSAIAHAGTFRDGAAIMGILNITPVLF